MGSDFASLMTAPVPDLPGYVHAEAREVPMTLVAGAQGLGGGQPGRPGRRVQARDSGDDYGDREPAPQAVRRDQHPPVPDPRGNDGDPGADHQACRPAEAAEDDRLREELGGDVAPRRAKSAAQAD